MEEDLSPIRLRDEPESAIADEPLDRALFCHFLLHRSNAVLHHQIYVLTTSEHKSARRRALSLLQIKRREYLYTGECVAWDRSYRETSARVSETRRHGDRVEKRDRAVRADAGADALEQ